MTEPPPTDAPAPPPPGHAARSQLAQLLRDVLHDHAPHAAKAGAVAHRDEINEWLDGFEAHAARFVGPFLQQILDQSDPPEHVRALLSEAIEPTQAFSAIVEQIFLYGIVSNIIGTSLQPFLVGVTEDLYTAAVNTGIVRPVDGAVLATAAGRGFGYPQAPTVAVAQGLYDEAKKSGIGKNELDLLASLVGLPPALQELFELYRRGDIQIADVKRGLQEGDFRDDWIDDVVKLSHALLTPLDFVRAAVQAQLPYADARNWANITGLDQSKVVNLDPGGTEATQDMFGLAFSIAGRPPGPQEMAEMAHRGIIPWTGTGAGATTFQQGIAESDVKTKWTLPLQQLSTYWPAAETVASLYERGGLTLDQAKHYWAGRGLDAATIAALQYVAEQQHITQEKLEAKRDVTTAYYDGLLPVAQATQALLALGYPGPVVSDILAIQDYRREIKAIDAVARRIETLYSQFKLTEVNALAALTAIGIPQAEANALLTTWSELRVVPIRLPTTTEIGLAVKAGTLDQATALAELAALGYQPRDAAIVLSAHAGTVIVPLPAAGSGTTG